jgi:hypothetical protein
VVVAAPRSAGAKLMRRPSISLRALIVGIAAGAPGPSLAAAVCGNYSVNQHYFAGTGQSCTAPAGTYTPVATGTTILPFNDPGYGFVTYGGGQLTTAGAVTITTSGVAADGALYLSGDNSISGGVISTTGNGAKGV